MTATWIQRPIPAVFLSCMLAVGLVCGCSGSKDHPSEGSTDSTLTEVQRSKIDPDLLRLMSDSAIITDVPSRLRPDSTREYSVRIETGSVDGLKARGLLPDSVEGAPVQAWLSLEDMRVAARMEEVEAIHADNDPVPRKEER